MTSICGRCSGSGIETIDTTNERGYLATDSRPCPSCARRRRRESVQWGVVAALALLLGVLPALMVVLR